MSSALLRTVAIASLALGCSSGSGSATFGTTPIAQLAGDSGVVHIDVYSAPDPIIRGSNELRYVITDVATGAPLDGLGVAVVPFMPAMGHGASIVPTVTAEGQGEYLVTDVVLIMPGDWQLRTTISGPVTDTATVTVAVP